jgi:hypothetical protein
MQTLYICLGPVHDFLRFQTFLFYITTQIKVSYFIYSLFDDDVSRTDLTASNERMINDHLSGNDL